MIAAIWIFHRFRPGAMSAHNTPPCHDHCSKVNAVPAGNEGPVEVDGVLRRSVFRVPGMDCPSEEQMIRLRLSAMPVSSLEFDLVGRKLVVCHGGEASDILNCLVPLGYGAELVESALVDSGNAAVLNQAVETKTLWILLAINAAMFVIEIVAGWLGNSAGLIADGADMFADAAVYGVALYAVGGSYRHKLSAARLAGILQMALAIGVLGEVARRMLTGSAPEELTMVGVSLLALAANIACLALIARHRQGGVHMRASYIFSANDVLANLGVIVAGSLVAWTGSPIPDWVIGGIIGALVLIGAVRILRLR
ncbi:MAG TPA: cation transporter [Zoogloea sp.]|nr:cation transporter [Zoogloea sp.]